MPSITVEELPGYPAISMSWEREIDTGDLKPAFHQVVAFLQQSAIPVYVIVDLHHNPRLPLVATMSEALRGAFRHPRLAEWLIIGTNAEARWIASMLSRVTRRNNILWFDSRDAILAYLNEKRV